VLQRLTFLSHWARRYGCYHALGFALLEDSTGVIVRTGARAQARSLNYATVPQTPLPNVTCAVGGVTIMTGGVAIDAIGVSGAPGDQFDEECARAGLAKIQDRMK
jgi:uncharacterized protein GlcG (DUF336 family)